MLRKAAAAHACANCAKADEHENPCSRFRNGSNLSPYSCRNSSVYLCRGMDRVEVDKSITSWCSTGHLQAGS